MLSFRATDVSDPLSQTLLTEYFEFREQSFPVAGAYRTSRPDATQFIEPHGVFVICFDDDEAVGCGGIRDLGAARFEIKHVWMRPAARGTGLGRKLLTELERRALEFGATEVVLDTNSSLEAAGALYRSTGYSDIPAYNDNPNADVWLRKPLR